MKYKYLPLLFFLLFNTLHVKANFVYNDRCLKAYNAIFGLRLNEARALIREERQQNPQNGIPILLENYVDFFSILTSDNKNDYTKWKDRRSARVNALDDNDKNSPYYLFSQAEVYLQWGLLKGKYGDYMASASDLKKARNLLKENVKKYPSFLPQQKDLALIEVVFGALPSNMKSLASLFGIKGNIQTGVSMMERLNNQIKKSDYEFYQDEVIFFLCYMDIDVLHNKHNYNKLLGYLANMDKKSLLRGYLTGYVAAKTAHNNDAIEVLENLPGGSQYVDLPAVNYLLGNAKLCRMDSDANVYLNKYLSSYRGMNFIKDTYLKLAYYYYLRDDDDKYNAYLKLVRTKGFTQDEKDKQALKEANDAKPPKGLLKARLYFDGGYYPKALSQLQAINIKDLDALKDRIEYEYRLGRVYEGLDRFTEALAWYQKTINIGKNTSYYFAANAALSMGNIYEQRKDYKRAEYYYRQAIGMKNHEYEKSIEMKAEEGLDRLH